MLRRFFHQNVARLLLVSLGLLTIVGCIKSADSVMTHQRHEITISGAVVDSNGQPAAGVHVFAGQTNQVSTQTDAAGRYSMTFSNDQLLTKKGQTPFGKDSYYLYFQNPTTGEVGISNLISFQERGDYTVLDQSLTPPTAVSGLVKFLPGNLGLQDGAGATVTVANQSVTAGGDGSFLVEGVPRGQVPIYVTAKNLVPYFTVLDLASEDPGLDGPIVLFSEFGIAGALIPVPLTENDYKTMGERFTREFVSRSSREAKWIRYHHDLTVLSAATRAPGTNANGVRAAANGGINDTGIGPEGLPTTTPGGNLGANAIPVAKSPNELGDFWFPADDPFTYHFPQNGGHILYYQYANHDKTVFSQIYQITVDVNVFHDTKGFVIGDGSGVSQSARVLLKIDLPKAADRMRILDSGSEGAETISTSWRAISPEVEHVFTSSGEGDTLGRVVSVQFGDSFGNESVVYQQRVELDLFPTIGPVVEDGSGFITRPLALIQTNAPPEASLMKIGDNKNSVSDANWTPVSDEFYHFFEMNTGAQDMETVSGVRKIQVQYQTPQGFISPLFESVVEVELFPTGPRVFTINGGALTTINATVMLDIDLPENAYQMRVFVVDKDSELEFNSSVFGTVSSNNRNRSEEEFWMKATPFFPYTLDAIGTYDIFVQFRDPHGYRSSMYKEVINYLPFNPDVGAGDFAINGGSPITNDPMLQLELFPPVGAEYFAVLETSIVGELLLNGNANQTESFFDNFMFVPDDRMDTYQVSGRGMKELLLQFQDIDGEVSPISKQQIFYQPFAFDPNAVVINGGAAATSNTTVTLDFNVPVNATEMRYGDSLLGTTSSPWQAITTYEVFELSNTNGNKRIYVQFRNVFGDESTVSSDDILLQRTDVSAPMDVIQINGGDATTTNPDVILTLNLPADAIEMRVGERNSGGVWIKAESTFPLSLVNSDGLHTVYVQYRTAEGRESSLYFDSILLENPAVPQWDVADDLIQINNDDAMTDDPDVTLSFNLPARAVEMRVAENPSTLFSTPFVTKASSLPFTLTSRRGIRTVYLQMRDAQGLISGIYYDSIDLDPIELPGEVADNIIAINDGDTTTDETDVTLHFNLPDSAVEFRVSNTSAGLSAQPWVVKSPTFPFLLPSLEGVRSVYLQYRNSVGAISAIYFDTIILDFPQPDDFDVSADIIRINNDSVFTSDTDVTLSFDLPDEAFEIRFSNTPGSGTWISKVDTADFTLIGGDGVREVYFQYRTENQTPSPIFFDSIILGTSGTPSFPDQVVKINEDDSITASKNVQLYLDLPSEADKIRVSDDITTLNTLEFQDILSPMAFSFTPGNGVRTVYLQYQSNAGLISPTFSDTILLNDPTGDVLADKPIVIEADAIEATSESVTITLDLPTEAVSVRFSEDIDGISGESWVDVAGATNFDFTLTNTDGVHVVYFQYRTAAGAESPLLSDSIILDLASNPIDAVPDNIFVVNNDDPDTTDSVVTLNFNLPAEAFEVKFAATVEGLSSADWQPSPSSVPLFSLGAGLGTKEVFMMYRTASGLESPVFSDSIDLIASP